MKSNRSISVECKNKKLSKLPLLSPIGRLSPENLASIALPKWLLDRSDFKHTFQEKIQIKHFDFCKEAVTQDLDKRIIKNNLKKFQILSNLNKTKLNELLEHVSVKIFKKSEILNPGFFYFVIKGNLLIDSELRVCPYNIVKSELSRIICETDVVLFAIESELYQNLTYHLAYIESQELSIKLESIDLFSTLKPLQYSLLSEKSFCLEYSKDFFIYDISEQSQYFYILTEGECELSSLITLRASNYIPSYKSIREEVKFESKFTKFKERILPFQIFGIKEAIGMKSRESHVRVISSKAKVIAIKWKDLENILKVNQISRIKEIISFEKSQEFNKKIAMKLKNFKKKFNALLDASCIKKKPDGRDIFDEVPKRKKLYIEALESSHRQYLREINFNVPGRNISSFY